MKNIIILVLTLGSCLVLGRCADNSDNNESSGGSNDKVEVSGETVYKKQCVLCHGSNGDLGASGASSLSMSKLDLNQRIEIITNGRNKMMAYSGLLDEEQIKAVAEYLETLKK